MNILEIYTFSKNGIGGVSSMVTAYLDAVEEFGNNDCKLSLLNVKAEVTTGRTSIDNSVYIFTQRSAVKKHLKDNSYDVAHIHTSREFLFFKDILLAKLIKKQFHIPVVITVHVGAIETVYNRISWFKNKSIKIINEYVDKVIFLSEVMRKDFINAGVKDQRTTLLYNFYKFTPTEIPVKEDRNSLQLLFVGAIHREKGIIELLEALSTMPPYFDYHLNVCGQLKDYSIKEDIEEYKGKLGNKVSFLGVVTGEDKTKIYQQSDILVLPSYHEGLPLVILEALGTGCAIMTTPVGAIPEILNNDNCLWLKIASSDSICSQLLNMSIEKLNEMKSNNELQGKKYSFEEHIHKLINIYRSVIKYEPEKNHKKAIEA